METKKLFVYKFTIICNKPILTQEIVEVTETPKLFRVAEKNKDLTKYRSNVPKTELNYLSYLSNVYSGNTYEMLSDNENISFFKEKVIAAIEQKKEKLYSEINKLNENIDFLEKEGLDNE